LQREEAEKAGRVVYSVRVSYMEIYNEEINDLLQPDVRLRRNLPVRQTR
jgi:hypothetical protein